ncbi:MAG: hypothetical protein AAF414_05000 [Pseudomonadota bacterium]
MPIDILCTEAEIQSRLSFTLHFMLQRDPSLMQRIAEAQFEQVGFAGRVEPPIRVYLPQYLLCPFHAFEGWHDLLHKGGLSLREEIKRAVRLPGHCRHSPCDRTVLVSMVSRFERYDFRPCCASIRLLVRWNKIGTISDPPICGGPVYCWDFPMKRHRKITLAQALRHESDDFSGRCGACGRGQIIRREVVLAMKLSPQTRVDQLEARYRCTRCGECAVSFQTHQRNGPFSDGFHSTYG